MIRVKFSAFALAAAVALVLSGGFARSRKATPTSRTRRG